MRRIMKPTFKARIYLNSTDYTGKIVDVLNIMFIHGKGTIETKNGEIFDCPDNFVILDAVKVTTQGHTTEILPE